MVKKASSKQGFIWLSLFLLIAVSVLLGTLQFSSKGSNFPVDLVYLWVDGSDPQWKAKKEYWQKEMGLYTPYSVGAARFRDREELLHSLRSVEKYLPWVRTIFIVTDGQVPKWLNTKHPKIRMVDHKDIFPADALPVFNSLAIETRLPYIPGLAEHFIYTNDDVFVNKPLKKSFFFTEDGLPIHYSDVRVAKEESLLLANPANKMAKQIGDSGKKVLEDVFQINLAAAPVFGSTHTMMSYRKSDFLENAEKMGENLTKTTYSKFRSPNDISFRVFIIPDFLRGKSVIKNALNIPGKCGVSGKLIMRDMTPLEGEDPCMFCLNDSTLYTDEESNRHVEYLRKRFPKKSSFEL